MPDVDRSKTCFVWSVLSGVQEVRMATGRHHLPKHPFTATPPAVSRAKFLDALVAYGNFNIIL